MSTIRSTFGVASKYSSPRFMAGLECEIEDIAQYDEEALSDGVWAVETDGSLRNSGREFISKPMEKDALIEQFKHLHSSIKYKTKDKATRFSQRTSIHAHINCLDLEEDQVKQIVLWYSLFEPIFFLMASPIRRNNIHCVGLDQTTLSESYKRNLSYLHGRWSKYTALNLLPLSMYGTIEFRHLEGTDDAEKVEQWLNILSNLWEFGKNTPVSRAAVLNDAMIKEAFNAIFKDSPMAMKYSGMLPTLLADSLVDIKLSLL